MAVKEAIWLRGLLAELGFPQQGPTIIHEDIQGCIQLASNPVHHPCMKHIDVHYHFVREKLAMGLIKLEYCATERMVADLCTKPLKRPRFEELRAKLNMEDKAPVEGEY